MNKTKRNMKIIILAVIVLMAFALNYSFSSAANVTLFYDSQSSIILLYPREFVTNTFFLRVPNGTVTEARMRIQGFDIEGQKGLPRDVVLVTDTSGSMSSSNKMRDAINASKSFIDNVDMNYFQIGLVRYSSTATLNRILMTDSELLKSTIDTYTASGYTNIGHGLILAINELNSVRAQRPETRKYILLMTDGWANCNTTSSSSCANNAIRNAMAEAWTLDLANQAAAQGIIIFAVSFGQCGEVYTTSQDDSHCSFMEEVAAVTGGMHFNAPTGNDLIQIYNEIAEIIGTQDFPTPTIRTIDPLNRLAWRYPNPYSGDVVWDGAECGTSSASCNDFVSVVIQQNLNQCPDDPCDIWFSAYSTTVGMLNLSELYIEINEPPEPINLPPTGGCPSRTITCPETQLVVEMDDGSLVSDPNDELSTLTWEFHHSTPSSGGAFFSMSPDFNTGRQLVFDVDYNHLNENFWEVYYFNISDPWGETTTACINVSYIGCAPVICGNNIIEPGEQCELNNTNDNIFCSQEVINCSEAPKSNVRDEFGDCDATCGCIDDPWGPLACIAPNCGAVCSDTDLPRPCTIPPGFSGVQDCNLTTCDWNPCVPIGVCGDGIINSPSEVCEPSLNDNNPFCSQSIENCTDAPMARTRDNLGFCNSTCGCLEDSWSDASCVASSCGAQCTAGTSQGCIINGLPGSQECNETTCEWEECIVNSICGNSIIEPGEECDDGNDIAGDGCFECVLEVEPGCGNGVLELGEECDDGNLISGDGCEADCTLTPYPVLVILDTTISFDYTAYPGYEYWLSEMLSEYATLPCDASTLQFQIGTSTNFLFEGPVIDDPDGQVNITPNNPDWTRSTSDTVEVDVSCFGVGETHQSSADLTIIYTGVGAPDGEINCASPTPRYLLHRGREVEVSLDNIFDFVPPYGSIYEIRVQSSADIIITSDLDGTPSGSSIIAQPRGFAPVFETVSVRVFTDNGVYSSYCPVIFFDMASNCDQDVCTACINNRDLSCFVDNNCLAETPVPVLNPFTPVRASRYVPAMAPPGYDADFRPLPGSLFKINRLSGSGNSEIFNVSGEEAPHGTMNASVMTYTFTGFVGSTRVCPLLRRLNLSIGEESLDPVTDLLITGSRAVIGFYEWGGIRSKGPYIFTAKVWLR